MVIWCHDEVQNKTKKRIQASHVAQYIEEGMVGPLIELFLVIQKVLDSYNTVRCLEGRNTSFGQGQDMVLFHVWKKGEEVNAIQKVSVPKGVLDIC